jgi:ferredoxin
LAVREQLKKMILEVLPGVDCVIGWGAGYDALHAVPLFMRAPEDVERFLSGPLGAFGAVQNPALFLPELAGKKIGLVVKGCDSRSVVQLLAENLIKREEVIIIGFPCEGVIDLHKLRNKLAAHFVVNEPGGVTAVNLAGDHLALTAGGQEYMFERDEIMADQCPRCREPNAVISDCFAGVKRRADHIADGYEDVAALERMSLEDRFRFWEQEMSRCVRCYACRNACPLCVCRDHCAGASRDPHWLTQADSTRDKFMFQIIHALHLAGRCTGCGECQRACPLGIPVLLLKRSLGRAVEEMFDYRAGLDTEAKPPLLTFRIEERKIKEREW